MKVLNILAIEMNTLADAPAGKAHILIFLGVAIVLIILRWWMLKDRDDDGDDPDDIFRVQY